MKDITGPQVVQTLQQYISSSPVLIVDFYAPWCGPCKVLGPQLEKITTATVIKINGDNEDPSVQSKVDQLMAHYQVTAYPTVLIFKKGSLVQKVVGANLNAIKAAL
jgi:thioredoxin-like negative regulator of GroEL